MNNSSTDQAFTIEANVDAIITLLGICLLPFVLLGLMVLWGLIRTGKIFKFVGLPFTYIYCRIKFGGDFFRKPTHCNDCNLKIVNGECSGCGWVVRNSTWGRYVSSDMGFFEFTRIESRNYPPGK